MTLPHNSRGMSLLEVMVTITIVALLTTLALPTYTGFIQKSHRSDATISLLNLAGAAERYFADNKSYTDATPSNLVSSSTSTDGYYTLAFTVGDSGQSFVAAATPVSTKSQADDDCYQYRITSNGAQSNRDSDDNAISNAACWPK